MTIKPDFDDSPINFLQGYFAAEPDAGLRQMSKHTPGPWLLTGGTFVYALNDYGTNSFWANIYPGSKGGHKSGATPSEEVIANANLIAAAPALLEALEQITNVYAAMRESLSIKYANDGWTAETLSIDQARAAIATAKGESK